MTNNLYQVFQAATDANKKVAGQIYYEINGQKFDFSTANLFNGTNNVYTKTETGLTASKGASVTANLAIVNSAQLIKHI